MNTHFKTEITDELCAILSYSEKFRLANKSSI